MRARWIGFVVALTAGVVACVGSSSSTEEPTGSSQSALTTSQRCIAKCNMDYTACASFSDPCACYPSYVSCAKACKVTPAFDPPDCTQPDASPPPDASPEECATGLVHCGCKGTNLCMQCSVCNADCGTPPPLNSCY